MKVNHAIKGLEKLSKKQVIAIVPLEDNYFLAIIRNTDWFHLGYYNPNANVFKLAPDHNTDKDFGALMETMEKEIADIYGSCKKEFICMN